MHTLNWKGPCSLLLQYNIDKVTLEYSGIPLPSTPPCVVFSLVVRYRLTEPPFSDIQQLYRTPLGYCVQCIVNVNAVMNICSYIYGKVSDYDPLLIPTHSRISVTIRDIKK